MAEANYTSKIKFSIDELMSSLVACKTQAEQVDGVLSNIGKRGNLNNFIKQFVAMDDAVKALRKELDSVKAGLGDKLNNGWMKSFDEMVAKMSQISELSKNIFEGLNGVNLKDKGVTKELRSYAEQLNAILKNVGIDKQIDLELFNTKDVQAQFDELIQYAGELNGKLNVTLGEIDLSKFGDNIKSAGDKVSDNIKEAGGKISAEVQQQIDELEKQKAKYQEALDIFSGKGTRVKTTKENDVATLTNLVDEFKKAELELSSKEQGSSGYEEAFARKVKAATLLKNTADYVVDHGSNKGSEYVAMYSKEYEKAQQFLEKFSEKQKTILEKIKNDYKQKIQEINTEIAKFGKEVPETKNEPKNATISYEKLTKSVERYYELQRKLDTAADSNEFNKIADEADKIADSFSNMDSACSAVFDRIQDGLGKSEALSQLANILNIQPSGAEAGAKAAQEAADAAKKKADEEERAYQAITKSVEAQRVMYHLGTGSAINGKGARSDTFADMLDNLTTNANGTRYEKYGYGVLGGGLFGVQNPSTIPKEQAASAGKFIYSLDLSKYNMYLLDTEERAANLMDFMSKLQKIAIRGAVPDYTGFNEFLGNTDLNSLYEQFKTLFDETKFTKEQLGSFIDEMVSQLTQAGLFFDSEKGQLDFHNISDELANSDNISTRFFKKLGYQGVNVGGTSLDGFGQGSVLFDFNQSDIVGYFNTIEQAVQDFQNNLKSGWVGSNEQLQQYLANIEEIIAKISAAKQNKLQLMPNFDTSDYDNTLALLNNVKQNISNILSNNATESASSSFAIVTDNQTAQLEKEKQLMQEIAALKEKLNAVPTNPVDASELESAQKQVQELEEEILRMEGALDSWKSSYYEIQQSLDYSIPMSEVEENMTSNDVVDEYRAQIETLNSTINQLNEKLATTKTRLTDIQTVDSSSNVGDASLKEVDSKIQSYEELCEVVKRYNELVLKSHSENLTDTENKEIDKINSQFAATKGVLNDPDKYVNYDISMSRMRGFLGEYNTDQLAQYLGIEIPHAASSAGASIDNLKIKAEDLKTKFLELTQSLDSDLFAGHYDEFSLGKSQAELDKAQQELQELADAGYIAADAMEQVNSAYKNTSNAITASYEGIKNENMFKEDSGSYDRGYEEGYFAAEKRYEQDVNSYIHEINELTKRSESLESQLSQAQSTKDVTTTSSQISNGENDNIVTPEIDSVNKVKEAFVSATEQKNQFVEANAKVKESAEASAISIEKEIEKAREASEAFASATQAKNDFANANQNVKDNNETDTKKKSSKKKTSDTDSSSNNYKEQDNYKTLIDANKKLSSDFNTNKKKIDDEAKAQDEFNQKLAETSKMVSEYIDKLGVARKTQEQSTNSKMQAFYNQYESDLKPESVQAKIEFNIKNTLKQVEGLLNGLDPSKGITGNISEFSGTGTFERDYAKLEAYKEMLEQIGYTLSEPIFNKRDGILSAKIIPIDGQAITDLEQARKILEDIYIKKNATSQSSDSILPDYIQQALPKLEELKNRLNEVTNNDELLQWKAEWDAVTESIIRAKQEQEQYAKAEKDSAKQSNTSYGAGVVGKVEAKHTGLINDVNSKGYANASGLTTQLQQYEQAYQRIITLQKELANIDITSDLGKQKAAEFDSAVKSFNKYGKQIENIIKKSEELQDKIGNIPYAVSEGFDLGDEASRRSELEAFARSFDGLDKKSIQFSDSYSKVVFTIKNGNGEIEKITASFNQAGTAINASSKNLGKVANKFTSFFDGVKKKTGEIATYFTGANLVYRAATQIRQGITYVKEIDTALTELKKVTDETDATYKKFLKTASQTAGQIGSTVKDFTNATADFARLGYNIEQASDLAKAASVYYNVGDDLADIGEASDSIISTMHGFGIEASNAMEIVDKFNEVGNNFAISSSGIGQSLLRSASAMAEAGNTIDETIGLITAANSVVQNPEAVGTAMKTLSLRIRGAKVELEDAGEDVDGMANSISELQKKLLALTGGKVNIMLDENTFKNTTEILREMSAVWDDMTDVNRASALELLGGKRQANVLAAVIKNFDMVEDAIKTSSDAAGSAEKENEKYLNSIQGKVDQFNNAIQTMWMNFISSDAIKFVVDLGTNLVKIADDLGLVGTALAALGIKTVLPKIFSGFKDSIGAAKTAFNTARGMVSTISSFNGEGLMSFLGGKIEATSINDITHALGAEIMAQKELSKELATQILLKNGVKAEDIEGALAAMGYSSANGVLSLSFKGLATSIKEAAIAFWASPFGKIAIIVGAITAIVAIMSALIDTHDDYVDELKETSNEISDVRNNIQSLNSELKTTQDRIDELNKKDKLSFAEEEELKNLKAQNAELERSIRLAEQKEKRLQKKASMSLNKAVASDSLFSNITWTKYVNSKGEQVDAAEAVDSSTQYADGSYGLKEGYTKETVTGTDFQKKIEQYKSAQEALKQAKDELEKLGDDAEDKEVKSAEAKVEQMQQNMDAAYDAISDTMDKINEDYLNQDGVEWQYGDPDELEDWQKQMNANLKIIYDAQDKLAIASDTTGKAIESAFSRVSLQTEFQDELKTIQETAGITGEKLKEMYDSSNDTSDTGIKAFIQSLIDCGVIANTSADELQKVVDLSLQLGGNTSEAAVANQKLARSQKRLQYYKQYKELNEYVNSLKKAGKNASNLTNEQKKLISSMSQNLQALAKEIDAYDILGAQIEEAKQAFEDFEKAKESDENTDYASTAGEMLQAVIEGFQSAEMGTEAFKSAFTGLIPESVYKDLDTLEEKYTAVAQYISEDLSKYFTIKYDDEGALESVEVTTKNIETFMDEAQSKGLATFENGQWAILENDFKKFASEMGITTSALVAFGEQADKLDADWIMGDYSSFFDIFDMDTESNIDKITRSLANLDLQLLNGQINVNDYVQEYAKLQNELSSEKANAVSDIVEYDNTTKEIDSLKTQLQEATNKLNELKTKGAPEDQIANAANEASEIAKNLEEAIKKKADLCQPSEMLVEVALENIQATKDRITAELGKIDANLQLTTTDKDGNEQINSSIIKQLDDGTYTINVDANLSEEAKAKVQEYVDALNSEVQVNQYVTGTQDATTDAENLKQTYNDLSEVIKNLPDVSISTLVAQGAVYALKKRVDKLKKAIDDLPKDVTITTTNINRTVTTGGGGISASGTFSSGNAHFDGAANASGTLGAEKTETSLVGELGPELRVRGNRWDVLGEDGAEFADVKKGDIIFNHKQTKQLLENGYINSRGKAFAAGSNAHAGIRGTIFTKYATVSGYGGTVPDWFGHSNILGDLGSAADSVSDASGAVKDATDDAKQTIDFIEYRLEEIENSITNMTNRVENFLDDTSQTKEKNRLYEGLIDAEKQKASTYLAAAETYNKKAAQLLSKVPAKYQEMAKNGAIAIKDFVGESQGEIADAIEEYRTWSTKAEDAENDYLASIAEISAKRLEQLQDIADDFENIIGLTERQSGILQGEMDLLEESGERLSENFYKELMKDSQKQISDLNKKRASLQDILNQAVKSGDVKVGSDDWYEMVNTIYDVDDAILECKKDIEGFQNSINDLYWDNLDKLIDKIDNVDSELSHLYNLVSDEEKVVDEFGNWTKDGVTALGLLAQQLEVANFKVDQYGEAIARLEKDYAAGLYSTDEYNEKLAELKENQWDAIEAQESAKKSIIDLNKTRIQAVKDGMQKEIDAYSELIDKKKEELSLQKEAHDFSKQVAEQQKNIADIEKRLAVIAGDNSASAIAQKKKLQAELAQAKEELDELYYGHSIDKQQEALDKQLEDYQNNKQDEMDALDESLKNENQIIQDSYATVAANTELLAQNLSDIASKYGITLSDSVTKPWLDGANAIGTYQDQLDTSTSSFTDQLKLIKQELVDLQVEADNTANSIINATNRKKDKTESAKYTPPKPNPQKDPPKAPKPKTPSPPSKGSSVTIKKSAKNFSRNGGNGTRMQSWVPGSTFTVYQVSGSEVLIGRSGGYTGWVKLSDIEGYASGAKSINKDQFAFLDELGEELQLVPDGAGRLSYVKKGTGIIPADLTERLMEWGQLDPSSVLEQSRPTVSAPHVINNNIELNMQVGEVVHIDRADNSSIPNITKAVQDQMDNYMKNINKKLYNRVR